jgi:hypothetical protein
MEGIGIRLVALEARKIAVCRHRVTICNTTKELSHSDTLLGARSSRPRTRARSKPRGIDALRRGSAERSKRGNSAKWLHRRLWCPPSPTPQEAWTRHQRLRPPTPHRALPAVCIDASTGTTFAFGREPRRPRCKPFAPEALPGRAGAGRARAEHVVPSHEAPRISCKVSGNRQSSVSN